MTEDTLTARNRINQRNFRARRQNYIRDLEDRIRKYEQEGVQATIEIQSAARQVTEQNQKLRTLLSSRYGMPDHEIEAYLGGSVMSSAQARLFALTPTSAKSFLEPGANTRSLIASHPHTYATVDDHQKLASSIPNPAPGRASLHQLPEHADGRHLAEPPAKKPRCELISKDMSISSLTLQSPVSYSQSSLSLSGEQSLASPSSQRHQQLPKQLQADYEIDPDTLSESSNPHTPADRSHNSSLSASDPCTSRHQFQFLGEDVHSNNGTPTHFHPPSSLTTDRSCSTPNTNDTAATTPTAFTSYQLHDVENDAGNANNLKTGRTNARSGPNGDETTCEDAARIIASMRGIDAPPEQILLELGCAAAPQYLSSASDVTPSSGGLQVKQPPQIDGKTCTVKNFNIFNLMDR